MIESGFRDGVRPFPSPKCEQGVSGADKDLGGSRDVWFEIVRKCRSLLADEVSGFGRG